jgi:cobalamin biosynthesis protein CobT
MREVITSMKKSTIAKLLAEEDISVVHKKTKTASFDVKKRELVLPIFKEEISNDVYDMFVCHEVGHSLWTPLDMLEQVHKHGIDKSVVNVIEDARIEAMIQNRYPGSRKNFTQGYKELLQRDFFGINKKDITKLNIIDKINIFFKTGLDVGFTDTESKLADKVAKCKTPEDVLALAVEIAGYHKQKSEEEKQSELKINIPNNAPKDENEESDDTTDSSGSDELDIQEDDTEEDNNESAPADQEANDNQEEESTGAKQNNGAGNGAGLGQDRIKKSDLVAHTDGAYQSAMNEHNDTEANNREYVNIPKKFHLSKLIINYKTVLADLDNHYKGSETEWFDNEYTKLVNDNKKIV